MPLIFDNFRNSILTEKKSHYFVKCYMKGLEIYSSAPEFEMFCNATDSNENRELSRRKKI